MGKRRKKGEGSVRQRKDGRWEGRVVIGYDEKGLPRTKNVLAKTKRECQEKLKQLRETVTGPRTEKVRPEMPFGEWLDFWYQNYVKPQIRPTTQANYEAKIYQHIIPELGKIPLNQLAQKDLQQFYARMKTGGRLIRTEQFGKGLSDSMVRGLHAACRSALEKAVQEELIRTNPAVGCKLPPKRGREMQVLGREELQRFLIQAQAEGYFELFLLDLCTGLRRGELLALQWDDLDFKAGTLTVNKQVYEVKGQLQVSVPKTRASIRRLVLPPGVVEVLRAYRETVDSRWMFPSPVKEDVPMTPGAVRRRLQIILERAGCKRIRFHDLRHTFATLSLESGMDVKTLSAMLGHVSAAPPCWAMCRRQPPWTSTPTSPGICRPRPRPRSTGDWATRYRRNPFRQSRTWPLTSSRCWVESESRAPGASPRSMTTCLRAVTPPPGRTAPSTPNASTPTPGRNARQS